MSKKFKVVFWLFMLLASAWLGAFIIPFVYKFVKGYWFAFPLILTVLVPFTFPLVMFADVIVD